MFTIKRYKKENFDSFIKRNKKLINKNLLSLKFKIKKNKYKILKKFL